MHICKMVHSFKLNKLLACYRTRSARLSSLKAICCIKGWTCLSFKISERLERVKSTACLSPHEQQRAFRCFQGLAEPASRVQDVRCAAILQSAQPAAAQKPSQAGAFPALLDNSFGRPFYSTHHICGMSLMSPQLSQGLGSSEHFTI